MLSPRVAYLDHQRLVLNVDNSVLKQRLAALAQDKLFKDGNYELLSTQNFNIISASSFYKLENNLDDDLV